MRQLLVLLAVLMTAVSWGQNIKLDGSILDPSGKPLEMANVMAVNASTQQMDSYAITNDKGRYQLMLKANATYLVRVSYLGMQSREITLRTQSADLSQNITLEPGGEQLKGVEIVREMPVSIKGDTIVYNADSFKSGTERKLEDVLKKLPGVEVNADGQVEVEGKKVQKLMVEGKDFFDGDTKLGVKNIPADAIDKVQVLRNYNEIDALKGLENNEENVAMNIKLKKGKKNFWFGDVTAGIGVGHDESRYLVHPKLFYYSPEYSLNAIGNLNNIGELPFTPQDYFKFTGGFKNLMRKGGTGFNVSSNDLGLTLLRNNRAREIDTRFGAGNFSYNPSNSWSLSGFAIVSSTKTDLETRSQVVRRDWVMPNATGQDQTIQNTREQTHQKSQLGLFKLSSGYKPSGSLQIDYDALVKKSRSDEYSGLFSISNVEDPQDISSLRNQDPVSLNQNFNLYYTRNKHVFAIEAQHLYQHENPFYNAQLNSDILEDIFVPENRLNLNQTRLVKTNKTDAKFDYYYMLTPKSNINVTFGDTYSYQTFDSALYQILESGTNFTSGNAVKYRFNDVFAGLHFKFIAGKFTFNPGLSVHQYQTADAQQGSSATQNFYRVLPDVYALYQIKKSESLTYNYAMTTDFTDVARLAEGFVMNSYNSFSSGNRMLENALVQTHSLRYFKYNMFNFTNIFGFVNYSRRMDAVKTLATFGGVNQFSTPYNSHFADEVITGVGNYGRSFGKYKASVSVNLNWAIFNNLRQINAYQVSDVTRSFTQGYTAKLATQYKHLPNLELGYNMTVNHYAQSTFYTQRPSARLDYYFWEAFSLVSEYEFYHYRNQDRTIGNQYDFLSASLIYQKKGSPWEYTVAATNLLNTTSLNDDGFTQFATRTSQYVVQPRYLVFSLKFNL